MIPGPKDFILFFGNRANLVAIIVYLILFSLIYGLLVYTVLFHPSYFAGHRSEKAIPFVLIGAPVAVLLLLFRSVNEFVNSKNARDTEDE